MPHKLKVNAYQVYALTEILRDVAYWGNREIVITSGDMFPDCLTVRFNDGDRDTKWLISRVGRTREVTNATS